jgi:hypothetical protein
MGQWLLTIESEPTALTGQAEGISICCRAAGFDALRTDTILTVLL